ncbi:MAG: hypothetical protein QXR44_05610 [Thermoproteota archaeon]
MRKWKFSDEELIDYISRHGVPNAYERVYPARPRLSSETNVYTKNIHRNFESKKGFLEDLGISNGLLLFLLFIALLYMAAHFFPFFPR